MMSICKTLLLGLAGGVVVRGVQVLAALSVRGVDEEERPRGDPRRQVVERRWEPVTGDRRHEQVRDGDGGQREPAAGSLQPRLADRPLAGAFRHDRAEGVVLGRRLDHLLAADGEADAADTPRVDVGTALDGYTINTAFVNHLDATTGSIEVGKDADLVVLDRDLLSIPPAELSSAAVQLTLVGGERVYAAGDLA